jgi:hypothetical protein
MNPMIEIVLLFCFKHFIVDFLLQPAYMYKNKGNLFHLGGYLHSGLHILFTWAILYAYHLPADTLAGLLAFEFIAHYLIDFTKVNVCKLNNWTATNSDHFWKMMGLDQFAHMLCYLCIIEAILIHAERAI